MRDNITLRQRFIALFFITIFVGYLGNVTFFAHEHKVGDVVIVHSHMGAASHSHSQSAINTIFNISNYDSTPIATFEISTAAVHLLCVIIQHEESFIHIISHDYFSLRAPPIL